MRQTTVFGILSVLLWCNLEVEVAARLSGWLRPRVGCGLTDWVPAGGTSGPWAPVKLIIGDSHCYTGQLLSVNASNWNGLFFSLSYKKQTFSQPLEHMALFLNQILADVAFHVRKAHFCRSFVLSVLHHVMPNIFYFSQEDWCLQIFHHCNDVDSWFFFHSFTSSLDSCLSSRTCAITPHLWGCVYKYSSFLLLILHHKGSYLILSYPMLNLIATKVTI